MPDQGVLIREATEQDVAGIQSVFLEVYGGEYPYQGFFDDWWLKRSVFGDDILMLVAEDQADQRILGTASVVFDVGAHSDLSAEFGRLAVHPEARGRRIGHLLMQARIEQAQNRIHVGVVENRCVHPFSQKISLAHGFAPVGFLPLKTPFKRRESISLFCRHFGAGLTLRCNHPRIVPEVADLAHLAFSNTGLPNDAIIDEESASYPREDGFVLEKLDDRGIPSLIRIERGRVRGRELFGPMRLQYGFFQLSARRATYLVAKSGDSEGTVCGAIGYIHDEFEKSVKIFELIAQTDQVVRFLLDALLARCEGEWGAEYVECEVTAHSPRMQRTLLELGFLPAAYVPALVFHDVERFDVVKMVKLLTPFDLGEMQLTPQAQMVADLVIRGFSRREVLPQIARACGRLELFVGLNEEQTERLAGCFRFERAPAGKVLFETGAPPKGMRVLIEGEVSIRIPENGHELGVVSTGESLGEVALLTGEPHSVDAVAKGEVVAGFLSAEALSELTRQRPDIGTALYRQVAAGLGRKLRRVDARLADSGHESGA